MRRSKPSPSRLAPCQKGNWRHDVPNEGAPTDAANGCSPLIRLLPTVAATCSPSGTSCHLPRSGGVFPQGGKAFGKTANLTAPPKAPLGGAVAQQLRGNRSAEPEKTVKRSSRRRGVNLQFFPVEPTALGLSRASSPGPVAGWVESRGREGGVGTPLPTSGPAERPCPLTAGRKLPLQHRCRCCLPLRSP